MGAAAVIDRYDRAVDEAWNRLRGVPAADRVFYSASEAADFSVLWHALGLVQAILRNDPRPAIELSVALGLESALVNGPVKSAFRRTRPLEEQPRPRRLRQPRTSSFPSGHASAAMVAASMLTRGTRVRWPWYLLAATVATSRIHVRIHHASDVAAGLVLGAALGGVARRTAARLRRLPSWS